jgi:NAD(P)-dependent dehydrogenase (short-subunit alcohol dehydrogenase family)
MDDPRSRAGRAELVVGASGAIGGAIARRLAWEGAHVALTYRSNLAQANALR